MLCSDGKEMYKKGWCTCRVVVSQSKINSKTNFFFTILIDVAVVVGLAPYNGSEAAVFDSSRNYAPQERCATKQKQLRVRLMVVGFHGFVGSSKSTRGDEGNRKKKTTKKTEREGSNYWMIRLVGLAYRCTCIQLYINVLDILDLIEAKKTGIIDILDEESKLPKPTAEHFTRELHQKHKNHFRLAVGEIL